jgi:hypothetical protein
MYIARSQWRHIDLKEALFAQSGGVKATLFRIKAIRSRRSRHQGRRSERRQKRTLFGAFANRVRFAPKADKLTDI